MTTPLAMPLSELRARYDAVVIGSGYGGGIAACRLSRAGRRVCVLERGREWPPERFPTTIGDARPELQARTVARGRGTRLGSATGLFDFRTFDDMTALVGCGLGGTSLINAGVFLEPDERVWDDPRWPKALRADRAGVVAGLTRAREMLAPTPYPAGKTAFPPLPKMELLSRVGRAAGRETQAAPLLTRFDASPSGTDDDASFAVHEGTCTGCGNCVSGCREGAKRTVDRTYLPDARAHGAHVFTELEVRSIRRAGPGLWAVHFRPQVPPIDAVVPDPFVLADMVVLAAGTFGSTEILLRSRDAGLALSESLGTQFSSNGNMLAVAHELEEFGSVQADRGKAPGPCIVGALELGGDDLDDALTIEDGTFPGALDLLVGLGALSDELGRPTRGGLLATLGARARSLVAVLAEELVCAPRPVQLFLAQGHDGALGRLWLDGDGDRLVLSWPRLAERLPRERLERALRPVVEGLGGRLQILEVPTPWGRTPLTVHPLGGCPMGDDRHVGAVDDLGRVFDANGADPTAVHAGLYVLDASIVPRSLGTNPVATICALAERACARMPEVGAPRPRLEVRPAFRACARPGASFSEAFSGWLSEGLEPGAMADPSLDPRPLGQPAEMQLVITVDDVDAFLRDPRHLASAVGTLRTPLLSDEPLSLVEGKIHLFSDDPTVQDTYYEVYELCAIDRAGARWDVRAMKKFVDGSPMRVYRDGTELPVEVIGNGRRLVGALTMYPDKLLRTVANVRTHRTGSARELAETQLSFQAFFAKRWLERVRLTKP